MKSSENLAVTNNEQAQRYQAQFPEGLAFAEYQRRGDVLVFTHTEVPVELEGQGIGSALVRAALDDVRAQGWGAVPACPFVAAFVEEHPEYADLVRS